MENLAQRVKARRSELGLTQVEVAKLSGLKQADISKIEIGLIQKTTGLLGLSRALQCNPEWLDTGDGATEINRPRELQASASDANAIAHLKASLQLLDDPTRERAAVLLQGLARDPEGPWAAWLTELLSSPGVQAPPVLQTPAFKYTKVTQHTIPAKRKHQ